MVQITFWQYVVTIVVATTLLAVPESKLVAQSNQAEAIHAPVLIFPRLQRNNAVDTYAPEITPTLTISTFLPFVAIAPPSISGQVTLNGKPAVSETLTLVRDCQGPHVGITRGIVTTTVTNNTGAFLFSSVPALGSTCRGSRIIYGNPLNGPPYTPKSGHLLYYQTDLIGEYPSNRSIPSFDIGEIQLIGPTQTNTELVIFKWKPRSQSLLESYNLFITNYGGSGGCYQSPIMPYGTDTLTVNSADLAGCRLASNGGQNLTWTIEVREGKYDLLYNFSGVVGLSEYKPITFNP